MFQHLTQLDSDSLPACEGHGHVGYEPLNVTGETSIRSITLRQFGGMFEVGFADALLAHLNAALPVARLRGLRGLSGMQSVLMLPFPRGGFDPSLFDLVDRRRVSTRHLAPGLPRRGLRRDAQAAQLACVPFTPELQIFRPWRQAPAVVAHRPNRDVDVRMVPVVMPDHDPIVLAGESLPCPGSGCIMHPVPGSAGRHREYDAH